MRSGPEQRLRTLTAWLTSARGMTRSDAAAARTLIAAARTLAELAGPGEVVPSPLVKSVHQAVRVAVAAEATARGLAGTARLTRAK